MLVGAIAESAFAQVGREFYKPRSDGIGIQVMQAKRLHARAIDQVAVCVEVVKMGAGGGVFARIQRAGNFTGGGVCIRQ